MWQLVTFAAMICFPHAKINLGLHILGKRNDGFHELQTCFYPVLGLTDVVDIVQAEQFSFTSSGLPIDSSLDNNLVVKAFRLMQAEFALPNVHMHLHKKIPMGAGLGGGSSNAAFVLRLCNLIFRLKLPDIELQKLAAQLGSDCACFVGNEPTLGYGRGEILEALHVELPTLPLLILSPGIHVSTREAFEGLNLEPVESNLEMALRNPVKDWKYSLFNSFEPSVFKAHPIIEETKAWLYNQGAEFALMSGSGSTVFGIFPANAKVSRPPAGIEIVFCSEQIHLNS